MRDDPITGEDVVLVVTGEAEDTDELEAAIEDVDGTVEKQLQFGAIRVEIAQEDIEALCEISGIESIETEHTVGVGGDAGEDLGGE